MRHGDGVLAPSPQHDVDFAVYEVGLGGRFDATNIVHAGSCRSSRRSISTTRIFSAIPSRKLPAKKRESSKPARGWSVPAERPEARAVIARRAKELDARLVEVDAAWRMEDTQVSGGCYRAVVAPSRSGRRLVIAPGLPGRFQIRNALTAATAARLLAERGFPVTDRGDRTRNRDGALARAARAPLRAARPVSGRHAQSRRRKRAAEILGREFRRPRILLVYGAMRDKAVDEIAGLLFPHADP